MITKSALVERDVDVLVALGQAAAAHVTVSIPFWDPERARAIEPYVPTPAAAHPGDRDAGPGRNLRRRQRRADHSGAERSEIPQILAAARDAGAVSAGHVLLRLPGSVKAVFEERLRAALPLSAARVLHRIRETRGGKLYDPRFGARGRGEGPYADAIHTLFNASAARLGLRTDHLRSDSDGGVTAPDVDVDVGGAVQFALPGIGD